MLVANLYNEFGKRDSVGCEVKTLKIAFDEAKMLKCNKIEVINEIGICIFTYILNENINKFDLFSSHKTLNYTELIDKYNLNEILVGGFEVFHEKGSYIEDNYLFYAFDIKDEQKIIFDYGVKFHSEKTIGKNYKFSTFEHFIYNNDGLEKTLKRLSFVYINDKIYISIQKEFI